MAININPGDVFLIPLPTKDLRHAHIVITAVHPIKGTFLCVPMNSCKNQRLDDRTVVFQNGDHEFVEHPTFINYYKAEFLDIATLQSWLEDGHALQFNSLTPEQFSLVCDGFNKTHHIRPTILQQYTEIRMQELLG